MPCLLVAAVMVVVCGPVGLHASASATPVTAPVPSAGSLGLRLLDVPVSERSDPRAQIYIIDRVSPGTVLHRRIQVVNTGPAAPVTVYAAAATLTGSSFLGAAGHTPNDLSTWVSLQPGQAQVHHDATLTATVTIAVPRDAAPGERYAVVWAETRSVSAAPNDVTEVSRVGIRIYLSVGPGAAPASNFTIQSLTPRRALDGQPSILAIVHNSGGRALDMNGTLQLSAGPGGLRAGPFPATLGITLAVDATEPVTVLLDRRLPDGPWDARITLRSGLLERTAHATITFPDTGTAAPVIPTTQQRAIPYLAIAGMALGALAAVGAAAVLTTAKGHKRRLARRVARMRRLRRTRPSHPATHG